MPRTPGTRHELDQFSGTADEKMRRHAQACDFPVIGMRIRIETVGEQLLDAGPAKFPGWQTDRMDYDEADGLMPRPFVAVGRRDMPGLEYPSILMCSPAG